MDINLGKIGERIGIGREAFETKAAEVKSSDASGTTRTAANLSITGGAASIASGEPVDTVPDAALRRDDALGKLVSAAFCLPAPPMPDFTG
jgi:hypothetical protein